MVATRFNNRKFFCMFYFYAWLTVQILLESLPVSSSGHSKLFELYVEKFGHHINHYQQVFLSGASMPAVSVDVLDHFLHGTAVLIIAVFFFSRWSFLLVHIRRYWKIILKIIGLTFLADCITALWYVLFHYWQLPLPLGVGFAITAVCLISLYWLPKNSSNSFDWRKACVLGCIQGIALLPGISRLATTYVGGRWLGLPARKAWEVSFLIQWPLITVAFLHGAYRMFGVSNNPLLQWPSIIVMVAAGIVSYYAFSWVAQLAYTNKLYWFGAYMALPLTLWLLL